MRKNQFWLSVVSIVLGLYAIYQSKRYKDMSDKVNKKTDELMRLMELKINDIFILERVTDHKDRKVVSLHKDCIIIRKTDEFKPNSTSNIMEDLVEKLKVILKDTYITNVIAYLEETTEETQCIVCLRNEISDLRKRQEIEKIRKEINQYGIDISLIF